MKKRRHLLPRSLFGRAFLILMLPMAIVSGTTTYMFYSRHWESVHAQMAAALAGEIALLVDGARDADAGERQALATSARRFLNLRASFQPRRKLPAVREEPTPLLAVFRGEMTRRVPYPFRLQSLDGGDVRVMVALPDGLLTLLVPEKRLESPTTYIFILWVVGAAGVLSLIATLFLRNQIRPILQLAEAAERFGKGQEAPYFKPHGATEVRRAAKAFLIMRERIRRQIQARTDMLAGISHDLRTPLTRMRLELAMLPPGEAAESLHADVQAMGLMIDGYLQFARGEGREESVILDLTTFLEELASAYFRQGHTVETVFTPGIHVRARLQALRRCLQNLLDNAFRHGTRVRLSSEADEDTVRVIVEDDGPGIPVDRREEALQPFRRLDPSRNARTGGVGLGLSIARDIALSHGGGLDLEESVLGGLRVVVRIPL